MELASQTADAARPRAGANPIYIVCSPRPGTGKTLLARLIIGFYLAQGRAIRAFDLDPQAPTLAEFAPERTTCTDIRDTKGQVELFDALIGDDASAKVIDVNHTVFSSFFDVADQITFFHEAHHRAIEPIILFASDLHASSPLAYGNIQERFAETLLVPVQNEAIVRTTRFREIYPTRRAAAIPLRILALPRQAMDIMQGAKCSFADVHDRLPTSIPYQLRTELDKWTNRAFLEFRELELRLLIEKLNNSLVNIG